MAERAGIKLSEDEAEAIEYHMTGQRGGNRLLGILQTADSGDAAAGYMGWPDWVMSLWGRVSRLIGFRL
jgi:hypothetical protein